MLFITSSICLICTLYTYTCNNRNRMDFYCFTSNIYRKIYLRQISYSLFAWHSHKQNTKYPYIFPLIFKLFNIKSIIWKKLLFCETENSDNFLTFIYIGKHIDIIIQKLYLHGIYWSFYDLIKKLEFVKKFQRQLWIETILLLCTFLF